MVARIPEDGFVAGVWVYVTLDIQRYAKLCGGCEAPARLHMHLYVKAGTDSDYKS